MASKYYNYTKSNELYKRACKVIPSGLYGHQGPAEGCWIPPTSWPFFTDHAEKSYFWDVDGNKFIDYMCAYGPNVLGYNDPDVDAAAIEQAKKENCVTTPSTKILELAELMVDTVASADWAFFMKNGNDTTQGAIMCARAYTHRKKIIFVNGFYHGVSMWTQKVDYPGVLPEDVANNLYVDWNDFEALEKLVAENEGEIAAFISTPYLHGNFYDNVLPADGYWQKVRKLCTEKGIVLIVDDVRAGFRLDLAGSDHFYGFEADLICFCKAIANGWNVSALCGKEFLKSSMSSLSYTGSYWMSAVPFAAQQAESAGRAQALPRKGPEAHQRPQGSGRRQRLQSGGLRRTGAVLSAPGGRRLPADPSGLGPGDGPPRHLHHVPPQPLPERLPDGRGYRPYPRSGRRFLQGDQKQILM